MPKYIFTQLLAHQQLSFTMTHSHVKLLTLWIHRTLGSRLMSSFLLCLCSVSLVILCQDLGCTQPSISLSMSSFSSHFVLCFLGTTTSDVLCHRILWVFYTILFRSVYTLSHQILHLCIYKWLIYKSNTKIKFNLNYFLKYQNS